MRRETFICDSCENEIMNAIHYQIRRRIHSGNYLGKMDWYEYDFCDNGCMLKFLYEQTASASWDTEDYQE